MTAPGEPREPATQALLEAAAKAIHEHDREVVDETCFDVPWDELSECYKPYYRAAARAARAVIGARLAAMVRVIESHEAMSADRARGAGRDHVADCRDAGSEVAERIAAEIERLCGLEDRGPGEGTDG